MPIDPAIRRLIASFKQSPNWDSELDLQVLQTLWPSLVGQHLARMTAITAIHGSRVVIRVHDENWRKQLIKIRPEILGNLNKPWTTPWIKEIVFTREN